MQIACPEQIETAIALKRRRAHGQDKRGRPYTQGYLSPNLLPGKRLDSPIAAHCTIQTQRGPLSAVGSSLLLAGLNVTAQGSSAQQVGTALYLLGTSRSHTDPCWQDHVWQAAPPSASPATLAQSRRQVWCSGEDSFANRQPGSRARRHLRRCATTRLAILRNCTHPHATIRLDRLPACRG